MLAIIPARGGSKGLPGKNIKNLSGKPLIAWTIELALQSKYIDRVVVSTDDADIAKVAVQYGAEVPFLRPKYLATDHAKAVDNYIFTIEKLKKDESIDLDEFIVLQPTSPLRNLDDLNASIELFYNNHADSVISYSKAEHPPLWAKRITNDQKIIDYFDKDISNLNRQEIPEAFMPNGAIFVLKYSVLKGNGTYYTKDTFAYIMPRERSVDIDDALDFKFAEFLIEGNNEIDR